MISLQVRHRIDFTQATILFINGSVAHQMGRNDAVALIKSYSKKEVLACIKRSLENYGQDQYFDDQKLVQTLLPLVTEILASQK